MASSNKSRLSATIAAALLMGLLSACSGPKLIAGSTGTKEQIKFVYVQDRQQGIIKCKVRDGGKPVDCREIKLILKD